MLKNLSDCFCSYFLIIFAVNRENRIRLGIKKSRLVLFSTRLSLYLLKKHITNN